MRVKMSCCSLCHWALRTREQQYFGNPLFDWYSMEVNYFFVVNGHMRTFLTTEFNQIESHKP